MSESNGEVQLMSDQWDPFLDAYSHLREACIAYDALAADAIDKVAKTKQEPLKKRLQKIRKELKDG